MWLCISFFLDASMVQVHGAHMPIAKLLLTHKTGLIDRAQNTLTEHREALFSMGRDRNQWFSNIIQEYNISCIHVFVSITVGPFVYTCR